MYVLFATLLSNKDIEFLGRSPFYSMDDIFDSKKNISPYFIM